MPEMPGSGALDHLHGTVVVAVVAVRVVQVAAHEVVDVVAMRDRLVAAAGTVLVVGVVLGAVVAGRAVGGFVSPIASAWRSTPAPPWWCSSPSWR